MVKHRRLIVVLGSIGLGAFVSWLMVDALHKNCANLPRVECRFLWGTAIASIVGGALLLEILIARKKARGEWRVREQDLHSDGPALSSSQVWFRSIARVVLASLLAGLPLIIKGGFALTVFGILTGISIDFLVRGIMNWMPPLEEDTKT